jgi:hypothetical protein
MSLGSEVKETGVYDHFIIIELDRLRIMKCNLLIF